MLELANISAGYGGVDVIRGIDLAVRAGEIVTLVGANGAGKSTLVKTISGLVAARSGTITFDGRRIETASTATRMRLGIAHVPEGRQVFSGLTVGENLALGAYVHRGQAEQTRARLGQVGARFPVLHDRMSALAGNLSGGQQQMLAIGRGLMAAPKLLILDEPSLGLSPLLVEELFTLIKTINAEGIAVLLVEQNVVQSLEVAQRAYILDNGRFVLQGSAADIRNDPNLKRAYLGM